MDQQEIINLKKTLKRLGNSTFIKYFYQFKDHSENDSSVDFHSLFSGENWKQPSIKMKTEAGLRIFKSRQEKNALEIVLTAKNDERTTELASEIFLRLYPNDSPKTIIFIRPEFTFGEKIISRLFSGYTIRNQYSVGNYKIDWYIEELKLAIEFDEPNHRRATYEDSERQRYIENELKCKFLRYKL